MSDTDTPTVKTMSALKKEVAESGIEQIERWDDPRLVDLLTQLHEYFQGDEQEEHFDTALGDLGIPARPVRKFFFIERTGVTEWNGKQVPVTARVEGYGFDGDEEDAINSYEERYGVPFEDAVKAMLKKNAMQAIMDSIQVELDTAVAEVVPA